MKISSFDIFDTCLIRKCGEPRNFFDVLSLRAFKSEPAEWERQEFVATRRMTENKLRKLNPYYTLTDIWENMNWQHPLLKNATELCSLEQSLEREMLVPVLNVRKQVDDLRKKGHKIVFISDMYLSAEFLKEVMREHGFFQDGDSLYVSCECHAEKKDGELYKYVCKQENTTFRQWFHYGDNRQSDYIAPRKLGIKVSLVNHSYTPYQQQWMKHYYPHEFTYQGILAGIGHALHYSTDRTAHTDFVADIIAPFYCSLVYRMMRDAELHGIQRLYFCARDAYIMYKIALSYKNLFPSLDCRFLYISRKALYDGDDLAKTAYYKQIGLATKTDKVGIVDIRSSGKTLCYLNQFLLSKGYKNVRGYYYELFCGGVSVTSTYSPTNYYTELSDNYAPGIASAIATRFHIFENFFPLNLVPKTINYSIVEGIAQPVYGSDDMDNTLEFEKVYIIGKDTLVLQHEMLVKEFTSMFISCGLYKYSDSIFQLAVNTLYSFFDDPSVYYLPALECLCGKKHEKADFIPYVKKESWLRLLFTRGDDTLWKDATIEYSNFGWFYKMFRRLKREVS